MAWGFFIAGFLELLAVYSVLNNRLSVVEYCLIMLILFLQFNSSEYHPE